MPRKYYVQAIFLLITVHNNNNQALQYQIQYVGLLWYWHWSRYYGVALEPSAFLPKMMQILKPLLFPTSVPKFRSKWATIPNLRDLQLHLLSKTVTSASLLNITYSRCIHRSFVDTSLFFMQICPNKVNYEVLATCLYVFGKRKWNFWQPNLGVLLEAPMYLCTGVYLPHGTFVLGTSLETVFLSLPANSGAFFFKTVWDAGTTEDSAEQNCTYQHDPEDFSKKNLPGKWEFHLAQQRQDEASVKGAVLAWLRQLEGWGLHGQKSWGWIGTSWLSLLEVMPSLSTWQQWQGSAGSQGQMVHPSL